MGHVPKNRNAWILPHCLATEKTVQIVEFDAASYNGGIMLPDKVKPSHLGLSTKMEFERVNKMTRTIKVHISYFSKM